MNDFDHDPTALGALTSPDLAPLFWPPARMGVVSAWYGHVPFAQWLVATHRPSRLVELGTHNGVSYAAFCEAVLRLGLDTACTAIDTWQGDAHAGFYDEAVYSELRRFHDARYGAFSDLRRARFDAALSTVPPGSIDLLHIDGRHFYDDVREDFETWRDRLSPRAVVLFHDTNVHANDFGVWRLWAELREHHPAFEFLHGHGLGVLAVGPEVTGAVAALCATRDPTTISTVRERFAALGDRWIAARDLLDQQQAQARLATDLAATKQWAETAQADINRLFPAHAALTERTRAVRLSLAEARHDLAALQAELAATRLALRDRETALAEAVQAAAAHDAAAQLQAARAAAAVEAALGLHAYAQAQLDALHAERLKLLGSTSWRLTAPLRRAASALRDQNAALPARLLLPPFDLPAPPQPVAPPAAAGLPPPASTRVDASRRALFVSGEDHTPGHYYRVERAAAAARALGFQAACKAAAPVGPDDLEGVGVVVLWRVPFSEHVRGIIDFTRRQGGIVIFDVDDLMFRPEMAVIDIIDGIRSQRFSELQTQAFFTQIGRTLKACDVVTCPTEELAHHARLMGRPAYVIPNSFDEAGHALARRARREWADVSDGLLRIGYAGGSRTHQRDFAVAAPAIARVLRETPHARLVIFRDPGSGEGLVLMHEFAAFADLQDRIEWRDMVKLEALPTELARFDINIAPLEADNPFCEAKSELKLFEAALAGVPTIASPAGPFRRAIEHGVTGFLAGSEEEWYAALARLAADASLRQRVAQSAYHVALGRFGPAARARAFGQMLAQAKGGAAGAAAFERDRFRATLPATAAPVVPEADTILSLDQRGDAAVTVIVPVFNYSDFVPEALQSAAAQTLAMLDLVVIDDASPDDSLAMVQAWVQAHGGRFNRVVVLRHRANAGLGFARNSGFAAAETPFVLPLDADNRLRPAACETLLGALAAGDAAFAYPAIQQFGSKSEIFGRDPYSVLRLQCGNYIDAMALVRKSAWAAAGGYDHVQYGWEDFDFWCRLAERGEFGLSVPEVLADYRVHAQSMLHTMTEVQDHKNDLVADLKRRHPWLDVPRKEEHGS
jgi:glycosyltransferase involved in cell wall biosynthesis/GT2 family glycosyltransferase